MPVTKYFTEEEKKQAQYKCIKEYKERNKETINKFANEKIKCECGTMCHRSVIARHRKSIKHIKNCTTKINNV